MFNSLIFKLEFQPSQFRQNETIYTVFMKTYKPP